MPRTTTRGYETPESTGEGSDVPADMETLAQAVNDDVDAVEAAVDAGFDIYKVIRERAGDSAAAPAAGGYVLGSPSAAIQAVSGASASQAFYLDPADFAVTGRDSKLRVCAGVIVNAVAPATTWTVGLYPVATWGGPSGAVPGVATLSAVVSGSAVAFVTPSAGAPTQDNSGDFAIPTAGWYVLAVVNSGAAAAGSRVSLAAALQLRQV